MVSNLTPFCYLSPQILLPKSGKYTAIDSSFYSQKYKQILKHFGKATFYECILDFDTVAGFTQSSAVLTTAKLLWEM